ncbi:MAG: REP-associated tyrosine transposase [Terracidiphilus sp.]
MGHLGPTHAEGSQAHLRTTTPARRTAPGTPETSHLHFITFSCYRRLPLLRTARARSVFVAVLDQVRQEYGFKLAGYVVMPEHVHLLISEPARGNPSTVLKMLKQRVSHRLRRKPRRQLTAAQRCFQFAPAVARLPQFWQKRFYDFNVWSRKKKIEKLGYMHANPLKRRLVDDSNQWLWSSYAFYQQRGEVLIEIDPVE